MASFESPYESILQGVSQQIPRLRLTGQVGAQVNMLSDPVTGPRRRPGAEFQYSLSLPGCTSNSVRGWDTDIGGFSIHVVLCVNTGTVLVLNSEYALQATLQDDYLIASAVSQIRATTVNNEFFLANVNINPVIGAPSGGVVSPVRRGFAYVVAGAFNKNYNLTVTTNAGAITATYSTPDAAVAGAAAASQPEKIAEELQASFNAQTISATLNVTVYRSGPYLYFEGTGAVTSLVVSTTSGSSFLADSGASKVRLEGNLPAILPAQADGYIVAVGQNKAFVYYQYDSASVSWLESGAFGSTASITSVPVSLRYNEGTMAWEIVSDPFEGRTSGDDDTNPVPDFVANGITGAGSYQGRLVLLVGPQVLLSSSKVSRRFMRSTVTSLLDEDPIAIGSSANSSAKYEYAVPFQKDLLLFSSKYQALIPGSNQAITPRTATVVITSTFQSDMNADPLPIGRTLLYPAPLSADFFGVLEMVSSQYADSQYVSNQATAHLPKYMAGNCRFSASSSVASLVVFGQSGDQQGIVVYQYLWSGDEKVQQAWHQWLMSYPISHAYFSGEALNFLLVQNGVLVGVKIDPKVGVLAAGSGQRPYMDLYSEIEVVANEFTIPAWLLAFDPDVGDLFRLAQSGGDLAGERVGIESFDPMTGTGRTVRSFPDGTVTLGIPYRSLLSPTPPQMRDRNGITIDSGKLTVLRFGVNTQNSSEYQVAVADSAGLSGAYVQGALRWSSSELELGQARTSSYARAIVPARTDAETTSLQIYTDDLGELNIVGLDYVARHNQKIKRR